MNLFKLFTLVVMLSVFAACGDDDDNDCLQADWVGTYSGTLVCTDAGVEGDPEDITLTVTASGTDNLIFEYQGVIVGLETDPIPFSNCNANFTDSMGGLTLDFTANLDGDDITTTDVLTGVLSSTCVINATRN